MVTSTLHCFCLSFYFFFLLTHAYTLAHTHLHTHIHTYAFTYARTHTQDFEIQGPLIVGAMDLRVSVYDHEVGTKTMLGTATIHETSYVGYVYYYFGVVCVYECV